MAAFYWNAPTGDTPNPAAVEQGVVIATRKVNGIEVKVLNVQGELHNDKNKVTVEFHDAQSGDLVDVGKVQFALSMGHARHVDALSRQHYVHSDSGALFGQRNAQYGGRLEWSGRV